MTSFIGNMNVRDFLHKAFKTGLPNHAYLLSGPDNIGKNTLVKNILGELFCENKSICGKCLNCRQIINNNHPDVWWIERQADKQDISIEQVREIHDFINLYSLSGGWRVVVINGAHYLNAESANALLKSLEEPASSVVFILISSDPSKILPTVRSRCYILQFGLVATAEIEKYLQSQKVKPDLATKLSQLSGGRPGLAMQLLNDKEMLVRENEYAEIFLQLISGSGFNRFVKFIESDIKESGENDKSARLLALVLLSVWRRTARDLLLFKLGLIKRVQHVTQEKELVQASKKPMASIIKLLYLVQKSQMDLSSNAHIKLTLEGLAYTIGVK